MAIHTIRMVKGGRTVLRKPVSEGLGRTDAVVIKAEADVLYLLGDTLNNTGPAKITAKRVGKNLQVAIGSGNPDVPDLIIEGYFDFPPAPVAGTLPEGGQAAYDLGNFAPASSADLPALDTSVARQSSLPGLGLGDMGWTLVALGGALALVGGSKKTSDAAPAPPDSATAAQDKVTAYANDRNQTSPVLADYTVIGVTGVTADNFAAINSAVDALLGSNVDTKAKLQTVIDAYLKILAEANGSSSPDATLTSNPLASDYAAIGANIGLAATSAGALSLLNDVMGGLQAIKVDTIVELNALAAVVDKVMNTASGTASGAASALSVADFGLLGLATAGPGAATSVNIAAINNAIANSGGTNKVDTLAELTSLVTAVATIVNYADDNTQIAPTPAQYTAAGITGVTTNNLGALNSAVDANAATTVDTKAKLQAVVDAYNFILTEVNGSASDATPDNNPTAAQFALIGANIGVAATNSVNLALLNDTLGSLSDTASVDTVQEVNDLAAAINAVMTGAAGGQAPTLTQLRLIMPESVSITTIQAVQNAIAATADSGLQVDTIVELKAITTKAVDAATVSQVLLRNFALSNINTAPTVTQYLNIGVEGVDARNVTAINSAVDALNSENVDTPYLVQTLVNAYNRILAEANGELVDATPTSNPTSKDFSTIGASIGLASGGIAARDDLASSSLALLNDAVAKKSLEAVDSVQEINDLAAATNAVMAGAAGDQAPTLTQLELLGVTGVTANTIQAVQNAITASADSGVQVDTMTELQAVVTTAVNAATASQTVLQNYAANNNNPAPSLATYSNLGISGVDATNLNAINSAVDAHSASDAYTTANVQGLVNAYNIILAEANGAATDATPTNNPTADAFAAIGASIGLAAGIIAADTDLASSALALMDNAIGSMTSTAVDTITEINAIGAAVDKVMNLAKLATGAAIPNGALTMADLTLLGVDAHLADTTIEKNAIFQAIIDSADSGSGVSTLVALQSIVNTNAH